MEAALAAAKAADTVVLVMGIDGTCRKRRVLVGCVFPYACPETVLADRSSFARKLTQKDTPHLQARSRPRATTARTQPCLERSLSSSSRCLRWESPPCSYLLRGIFIRNGQLENHQKTVSRHAEVQISGRFRSDRAVSTFKRVAYVFPGAGARPRRCDVAGAAERLGTGDSRLLLRWRGGCAGNG